jgi:putative N6-adenine-specific DNA methylase
MGSENFFMLAKTYSGLEDVLKDELIGIGASDVTVVSRGVKFSGSKEMLYKANFCCLTALRILKIIGEFKVKGTNDLYNSVRSIDWSLYFDIQQTFSVNSTVDSEAFNNSMFVNLKTKDAIVDQFKANMGKRPSVNTENPDIRINVHASADEMTISIDSSGESLHKRGYRIGQNEASMSEVLAAGILKLAGWRGQCDLYDPMCGSGTIPIEAELIARNIPPGIFRKSFDFEKWKDFEEELFEGVYNAEYEVPFEHTIYASDISSLNVKMASDNARNAGLKKGIQFSVSDFASIKPDKNSGLLIVNPPYGQRMNERLIEPLYTMIGDSLKKNFKGFKAWIYSNSEEGFKNIGLRPSQKIKLYNGPLECDLRSFELYEGSKKQAKQNFAKRPASKSYKEKPDLKDRHMEFEKNYERKFDKKVEKKRDDNTDNAPVRKRKRI